MSFVFYILFGIILGLVANALEPKANESSLLGGVLLAILGAVLGGSIANLLIDLHGAQPFAFAAYTIALLGSLVVLFMRRIIPKV